VTLLSPYYLAIDGHELATYANGLEVTDGIDTIPGRRLREQDGAYQDGSYPTLDTPSFYTAKRQLLTIWLSPYDEDGNVTFATGPAGHLQANKEALFRILGGKTRSNHTIDWIVPTSTATKTLRNQARIYAPIINQGSSRLVRRFRIELTYPFPFWHDVTAGLQTVAAGSGATSLTPQGSAPLVDAAFVCTAAGRITHTETGDYWDIASLDGATSITIQQGLPRTVLKNTGADARHLVTSNRPWGIRLDAGVLANFSRTGTWAINYYQAHH
jgi:hypothetical protein